MRTALTLLLAAALAASLAESLAAYDRKDFDRIVDFATTVKTLDGLSAAQAREQGLAGRLLLLDGTVAALRFLDSEEATFAVEMELVAGEWVGLEEVKIYRCRIRFQGPAFFRQFPRRAPKSPEPSQVALDDRVLIVAKTLLKGGEESGQPLWLLQGLHVRPIR
jgi:hypothetical protein